MIGQTVSHYAPKAHPPLADKILEELAEAGMTIYSKPRIQRQAEQLLLFMI